MASLKLSSPWEMEKSLSTSPRHADADVRDLLPGEGERHRVAVQEDQVGKGRVEIVPVNRSTSSEWQRRQNFRSRRAWRATGLVLLALLCVTPGAAAAPTQVTEYGVGGVGMPRELVVDGSGNLWFTEGGLGAIGRVTPNGQITSYDEGLEGADPTGLIVGPGGDIWFGLEVDREHAYIGRITASGAITLYGGFFARTNPEKLAVGPEGNVWFISGSYVRPSIGYVTPLGAKAQFELFQTPSSLAAGAEANMWFTAGEEEGAAIGKVDLKEGGGATVTLLRAGLSAEDRPEALVEGPDGNLWFTNRLPATIGRVMPNGQIDEFPAEDYPEQIVSGSEGSLWILNTYGLSRATTRGAISYIEAPPLEGRRLRDITIGPEGDLWFAAQQSTDYYVDNGTVGRVTAAGKTVGYSADLPAGSQPEEIVGGAGSELWFADRGTNPAIGRIVPGEDPEPTAPPARSPSTGGSPPPRPSEPLGPGKVSLSVRHLSVGQGAVARMLVTCSDGRGCGGRLTLTTVVHRPDERASLQPIIATRKFSIGGGRSAWLSVRLTRRARGLLLSGGGRLRALATFSGSFTRLDGPTIVSLVIRSGASRPD